MQLRHLLPSDRNKITNKNKMTGRIQNVQPGSRPDKLDFLVF